MGRNNAKFNNNAGINKVDLKGVLFPILNNSYVLNTENTNNTKLNSSVPKFKSEDTSVDHFFHEQYK
jgi:hypothetical protein